jgi:hypothetical protein
MSEPERVEVLILGSGFGGKLLAWHMARSGRRTAVVERRWIGGSCPNIACLPSKNEIWSARIAHQAHHAAQFGTMITGPITTDMAKVRQRKRDMVAREIELHLHNYKTTGAELIMGSGRFVAPKSVAHLVQMTEELKRKGVALKIVDMGVDTGTPTGRLFLNIVGSIAEFEREIMLERQREGIAAAKAAGKYKGRVPTVRRQSAEIHRLAAEGVARTEIARRLGVGESSVYRVLAA